jgi:ABC-2 type transport system permease protein
MGPWRLELLRIWRTRRLIVLTATFLILGLGSPVLTYYLPDLVKNSTNGVQIILPEQTAADGIASFASNIAQLGTLVVVVIAASTLAIDADPGLAAFYRTRVRRPLPLVMPRYLVVTAASIAALALGTLGAWYETTILLGSVSFGSLMLGLALEALWLCFVTSIVVLFSSTLRGAIAVVGASIALLLALSLVGSLTAASSWMPTRLSGSGADFIRDAPGDIWHAIVVTMLATVVAVSLALYQFGNREFS